MSLFFVVVWLLRNVEICVIGHTLHAWLNKLGWQQQNRKEKWA